MTHQNHDKNGMPPVHPGEVLREDYLVPLGMSANRLAAALGIPTNRVTEIIGERRAVTAGTALRLARALGTCPGFWMICRSASSFGPRRPSSAQS